MKKWVPPGRLRRDLFTDYAVTRLGQIDNAYKLFDFYALRGRMRVAELLSYDEATKIVDAKPITGGIIFPDHIALGANQHVEERAEYVVRQVHRMGTPPGSWGRKELHDLGLLGVKIRLASLGMPQGLRALGVGRMTDQLCAKIIYASKLSREERNGLRGISPNFRGWFPWIRWEGGIRWASGSLLSLPSDG